MPDAARRLFVHLGPAKTGTSAVQAVFRNLSDPRLTYPRTGQWPDGSHNLLALSINGLRERGPQRIPPIEDLMPPFLDELAQAPGDALISSEILCTPPSYHALMDHLKDVLPRFDAVVPLLALRHPIERAASAYNQLVKDAHFGENSLPDTFLLTQAKPHQITPFIQTWSHEAPGAKFLLYHPKSGFLSRFCAALDRPDLAPEHPGQANRSLGGTGLALLLLGNRHLTGATARAEFFTDVVRGTAAVKPWKGPSFPFSPTAVDQAMEMCLSQDLALAHDTFGIDLTGWTAPDPIALSDTDADLVRELATKHLSGAGLADDIARVLACFKNTPHPPPG